MVSRCRVIKSPGTRTRILYALETYWDSAHKGVINYRSTIQMRQDLRRMWAMFGHTRYTPFLEFIADSHHPYCEGMTRIVLTSASCTNTTLLHEVTHASGFGTHRNPHSIGFVREYVSRLSKWFGWEAGPMVMDAQMRKLL